MLLPVCNALWVGSALGAIERACLGSFVDAGHAVDLYTYDAVSGVPAGVHLRDAAAVLPRESIIRHRESGSVSLFSNRFRYALLKSGRGLWIDCDMLCLRPIPDAAFIFGRQAHDIVNGAVLKLPCDHPVLDDLLAIFTTPNWVPPWDRRGRRLRYWLRYRVEADFGIAAMPWGIAGPRALSYYLPRHSLDRHALPVEAFYPLGWHEADMLGSPDPANAITRVTAATLCMHLWSRSRSEHGVGAAPGSFLAAVIDGSWRSLLGR
jgi:hypothetical protein